MEQNILPKKIKITIFLMAASGILLFYEFIYLLWVLFRQSSLAGYNMITPIILTNLLLNDTLLVAILFILFAYFLKKKKKWAWFAAIVLLLKEIVGSVYSLFLYLPNLSALIAQWEQEMIPIPVYSFITLQIISIIAFIFILLSLIFLILDRKNYWQISS